MDPHYISSVQLDMAAALGQKLDFGDYWTIATAKQNPSSPDLLCREQSLWTIYCVTVLGPLSY